MSDCWSTDRTPVDMGAVRREAKAIMDMDYRAAQMVRSGRRSYVVLGPANTHVADCETEEEADRVASLLNDGKLAFGVHPMFLP